MKIGENIVPSLRDNIGKGLDNFKIGDFIEAAENNEYLNKLPGVKSLLLAIKKGLAFIKDLIDKILNFIQAILDLINMFLGKIEDFLKAILDLINQFLGLFGLSLEIRSDLLDALLGGCVEVTNGEKNGWDFNILDKLILAAIIVGVACANEYHIFSQTRSQYIANNPNIQHITNEINEIKISLDNSPIAILITDKLTEIENQQSLLRARLKNVEDMVFKDLLDRIVVLEDHMSAIDAKISSTIGNLTKETINASTPVIMAIDITNIDSGVDVIKDNTNELFELYKERQAIIDELEAKNTELNNRIDNITDEDIKNILSKIEDLKAEINRLKQNDKEYINLNQRLGKLTQQLYAEQQKVDEVFADVAAITITGLSKNNKVTVKDITKVLDDIISTPVTKILVNKNYYLNLKIGTTLNTFITTRDTDPFKGTSNLISQDKPDYSKVTKDDVKKLIKQLALLDKFAYNKQQTIGNVKVNDYSSFNNAISLGYRDIIVKNKLPNTVISDDNKTEELGYEELIAITNLFKEPEC
jgi:hypothetical protein